MKVLITGGHFSPAYAVVNLLKKRGVNVAIAGRRFTYEKDKTESLEYRIAQKEKLEFFEIKSGRVQRTLTGDTLPSLLKVVGGFSQALKIVKAFKPDVVLTFGGYLGFPVAYAAKLSNVPVVLHEQTQNAGMASKAISKIATKICISFESSISLFPGKKTIFTGNPVREEIFKSDKTINIPQGKTIYITGGSGGSHVINAIVKKIIERLLSDFVVIHQVGSASEFKDFEELTWLRNKFPGNLKERYVLREFIFPEEIGFILNRADLIVARAGINTVSEILAVKKVSLLIPLKHGQGGEQLANAKLIKSLGIGEYIEENNLNEEVMYKAIVEMVKNEDKYLSNMKKAESYFVKDAADKIVEVVESVVLKRT